MEDEEEEGFGATIAIASECTEAEKEYEKVLEQMREAEGLKMYADVYTKLYDSYYKLKDENIENTEKINQFKTKLARFDDTISDYQTELNEAHKNIETLQLSLDEARAMADAMHARELASVESLETIKKTVAKLEKELTAIKRAGEDDAGATSAVKEKEKFEKEKARLVAEMDTIKIRLAGLVDYVEELDSKNTAAEEKIAKLEEQLEEADNNAVRNNRLVEHMRNESNSLKQEMEQRNNTIKNLHEQMVKLERTIERRDKQLHDLTAKMDTAATERDAATARAAQLRDTLDRVKAEYEQSKQVLANTVMDVKSYEAENTRMKAELTKCSKVGVQQLKRYQKLERLKSDIEFERDGLRQQISVMEREIMLEKKQAESDRRDIENLNREKEILNKSMQKIQNEAMDNLHMLHLQENRMKQVEHELEQSAAQINRQRLTIRQLEKDKDRMLEEAMALNEKIDEIAEEVRLRTADIMDLKKALREEQVNSRKLCVALDTCRVERNMLHKNYTEALDEIQDLKQKLRMLAYQIEQLKEDISGKESGLKSCEGALSKCNKKVEMLRMEVQGVQAKLGDARADIAALRQEEARLNRIIHEGDTARAKLLKDLEGLMNERDVVGAQLVRRNDEISLLYEKIRILEVTLHRGERQYEQRVEDIRLLRLEIIRLRKEKNLLSKGIENMTDLRLEVFNIERELGRERLRVRALEEALETPLNVHRWRKLQGTDPESVQLTHKLRVTQKKVLAQSEMLVLRDRELKETKNLYTAVKDMLALQPSPEIQVIQVYAPTSTHSDDEVEAMYEDISKAIQTSKTHYTVVMGNFNAKLGMREEVSMREQQVTDLRMELDRSNNELFAFKQKYYEMKRALDAEEARRLRVPGSPDACPCPPQLAPGTPASH